MTGGRQKARHLCLVLALCMAAGPGTAATLTPDSLRADGFKAIAAGQAEAAHGIALALLQRDPNDFLALILRSRSARALGQFGEARNAARAAWSLAKTPAERYSAAMVRAQALASSEDRTAAQFWLRRAVQLAPDPQAKAVAIRDFTYVRDRSHWSFQIEASVVPSSNVNNGSANSTIELLGLPFVLSGDAQALSGLVGTLGVTGIYRLTPTQTTVTQLRFSGLARHNWLSTSARAQAPGAKGSDYDYSAVETGVVQQWRSGVTSLAIYNWGVTAGHNWYGGADLSNYLRLQGGVDRPLNAIYSGNLGFTLERQARQDVRDRSATVATGTVGVTRRLANSDQVSLTLGDRFTRSNAVDVQHTTNFAQINWTKAKPVLGVKLGASLYVAHESYAVFPLSVDGRRDLNMTADLSMLFSRASYMGFSPSVDVQFQRVHSNVSLYETRDIGIAVGVKSDF
ncbi:MAG: hypothetical protein GC186_09890 [Rhodobacteraceae bacterium]|nr:hypothetical protein [Paracoccaceae bacterium]